MIERPDKLNNQAIILASNGEYKDAIACYQRAITIDNNNYLLWYNLGVTYRDSGDLTKAVKALEMAHKISPLNEEVLETLATTCLLQKNFDKCIDYCMEALDLNACNSHFWNLMGVVKFQQAYYNEAAEHFELAVSINPYYEDALYNLKDTYLELDNKIGADECSKRLKNL